MKTFEYTTHSYRAHCSTLQDLLNNMGDQGWELCGCLPNDHSRYTKFMFKREVPDQDASDLKLIDELLCLMTKGSPSDWAELECRYSTTREAMTRLREAKDSGELKSLTMSLSTYFSETS